MESRSGWRCYLNRQAADAVGAKSEVKQHDQVRKVSEDFLQMDFDKPIDAGRTAVLALLQLAPFPGPGALAQVIEHFWRSSFELRTREALEQFRAELARLGTSEEELWVKVRESEEAQLLISDTGIAVRRTTSKTEREGLGRLLARGLCSTERELIDTDYVLRRWGDLDAIEKLIFTLYGDAYRARKRFVFRGSTLEAGYFSASNHPEVMYKDAMHLLRMDRLLAAGLIRPTQPLKWKEGTQGYQFENFMISKPGEILYDLMI